MLKLQKLFVFSRFKSLHLLISIIINLFLVTNAFAQEKLIFAIDIIRHGDRTPLITLPVSSYQWSEGLGQLTSTGMSQEYQLGRSLHDKYVTQYHLLPEHYSQQTMYVRSSAYDRTLMSAQSLLFGLYPLGTGPLEPKNQTPALPQRHQPIPIYTQAKQDDPLLSPFTNEVVFNKLLQKHVYSTPEWIKKETELKSYYTAWSNATGVQVTDPMEMVLLADALYIYQLYDVPMPQGLSDEDVRNIIELGHWELNTIYKNNSIATVGGNKLFKTIVEQIQQVINNQSSLKYILYSAHDTNIASQMAIVGAPLDKLPRYASNLNFSLFQNGERYFYVKITYNNKPVFISSCSGFYCTIDQLLILANQHEVEAKRLLDDL